MNTISTKIKQFFSKNRNNILFVVLFVGLLYMDNIFAVVETATSWTTWQQTTEQDPTKIILWLSWFLNIVWAWLGIMTGFVMKFLQPGWTSWSVLWLNDILKNIWVMISNIVYFVFAFLLIAIAFMNIIWKWENNYQMKTALPKLIVWIIMVPFTWFIVQFIVSLSTIFTASMISLPYDIFNWSDKQSILSKINLPTDCTIDLTSSWWTKCEWTWKALSEVLSWKDSIWWIIWFYSYWLINIDEITKLKSRNVWTIKTIFDLWLKAIVDLIFIRAYLILLRAIAMVLFTRWIYLWLYAMFSPVFWLMYFFGKSIPSWMKKLEILTIPKLIWLAFVPVYVAAALSFWFIFLISAWHSLSWIVSDTYSTDTTKTASTWEGSDIAWIKFKIIWGTSSTDTNAALSVLTNTKDWAKNLVWQFIMQLFGIAILWMVVMAALQSSEITKSIVEPIAQFWWSIWKTITSLPKYAPIFPGWMSASSMSTVWNQIAWSFESAQQKKWSDFYSKNFGDWWKQTRKANEVSTKAKNALESDLPKLTKDLLKEYKDVREIANNTAWRDALYEIANRVNLEQKYKDWIKKWNPQLIAEAIWQIEEEFDKNQSKYNNNSVFAWINTWKLKDEWSVNNRMKELQNSKELWEQEKTKSTSSLPTWITKDNNWNINININNKNESIKVEKNWKIDDWKINDLVTWFKDKKVAYLENDFKKLLNDDLWITDNEQKEKIWKKLIETK